MNSEEASHSTLDIGGIIANVAGSGVGGGILLAIVGWIRSAMGKS